jgi:hypothetical protein
MGAARIKVWQCVGCGRIDDPQPCVGICQDSKVELVLASEHDAALAQLRHEAESLREVVLSIAGLTPRTGQWEASWLALQARARLALAPPA